MNYRTKVHVDGWTAKRAAARFKPRWALVCSDAENDVLGSTQRFTVFTHHNIDVNSQQAHEMGQGIPVRADDAVRLLAQLGGADMSMLPECVFAYGVTGMAWTVTGKRRPMLVKRGTHLQKLLVPWPNLLLVAAGSSLKVYARKKGGRPKPEETLFHAPLPNIYEDGLMCWGDIEVPAMGVENIARFESAVFDSAFTHANHDRAIVGMTDRDDLMEFWRQLSKSKATTFPMRRLVAADINVARACDAQ